jgi:hypothetical protein
MTVYLWIAALLALAGIVRSAFVTRTISILRGVVLVGATAAMFVVGKFAIFFLNLG